MLYWRAFVQSFLWHLVYKHETVSIIIANVIDAVMLIVFWSIVASTADIGFNAPEIMSYFLIAMGVRALGLVTIGFGSAVSKLIQYGSLNYYLIKPIRLVPYLFMNNLGTTAIGKIVAVGGLGIGVLIANPKLSVETLWLLPAILSLFFVGFSINILVASFAFYFHESSGFKNVIRHILRFLSGLLIPLSLMPETLRDLLLVTPFPILTFVPTEILRTGTVPLELQTNIILSAFWAVLLMMLALRYWANGLKKYEAIGI